MANAPRIVVTIKPLHSIVANITSGVTTPELLLPDGQSPHTFRLKPSHRSAIEKANLVFWIGPQYELHLEKIMALYPQKAVALIDAPGIHILKNRSHRDFQIQQPPTKNHSAHDHSHGHGHDHQHHTHDHNEIDGHIWLSVDNAIVLAEEVTKRLKQIDPAHQKAYEQNRDRTILELKSLKQFLANKLSSEAVLPYLVFHDAYQYFEKEYKLNSVGTVLINPHLPLTPRAIHDIRQLTQEHRVQCIYYEPEFNHDMLKPLINLPNIQTHELDPLGVRQEKGPDCYRHTLLALASQLLSCQAEPEAQ